MDAPRAFKAAIPSSGNAQGNTSTPSKNPITRHFPFSLDICLSWSWTAPLRSQTASASTGPASLLG